MKKFNHEVSYLSYFFGGVTEPVPTDTIHPSIFFLRIKTGFWEDIQRKYQAGQEKSIKESAPCVTPVGTFKYRNDDGCLKPSGLICLDIDAKDNTEFTMEWLFKKLSADRYSWALHRTISGSGLALWIKVNGIQQGNFQQVVEALDQYYLDTYMIDIHFDKKALTWSQPRTVSYDPDIFINDNPKVWDASNIKATVESPDDEVAGYDEETWKKVEAYRDQIVEHKIDITDEGVTGWGKILFGLARSAPDEKSFYSVAHDVSKYFDNRYNKYSRKETDKHCNKIWEKKDNPYSMKKATIASFFDACNEYGIVLKEDEISLPDLNEQDSSIISQSAVPVFPLDVFPTEIEDLIRDISEKMGMPINYLGPSFLVAAAGTLEKKLRLLTTNGYEAVPILYLLLVGGPGNNKSTPIRKMMRPLRERTSQNIKSYNEQMVEYKQVEDKNGISSPDKPIHYVITDCTLEGLYKVLGNQRNGLIVYRDEAIGWFKNFNRYSKNGSDIDDWISFFQGETVVRTRATEESVMVQDPVLCVVGTIQTHRLNELFKSAKDYSGFMSRFIFTYDGPSFKTWGTGQAHPEWNQLHNIIDDMIDANPVGGHIQISPGADEVFREWNDKVVLDRKENMNVWEQETSKKLDIYIFRLALILHWIWKYPDPIEELSKDTALQAIKLLDYFIACREVTLDQLQSLVGEKMPHQIKDMLIKTKATNNKLELDRAIYLAKENNTTFVSIAKVLGLSREWVGTRYKVYRENHVGTSHK